tara:strand:+ start:1453 stop:2502 length:1050 start_codon:yes stop_codon:yes gene_type:complete
MSRARTFADLATASEEGSLASPNMVINGDMAIHQRVGTDTHNDKAVDQIQLIKNNLDTADFNTKHQSLGGIDPFADALEITCTTADTSIGANELIYLVKKFEAQNLQHLSFGSSLAKTTTLSFHVKSNLTGTFSVGLVTQDGTARNIGSTYTIDSANTWEKKTITFVGDPSATIANDNGHGLDMTFILAAGSNWTSTANSSWADYANGRLAHGHNVNIASSTSNEFYITGIQWELGSVATPYKHETISENLARCQRYFFSPQTTNNFMGNLMAPDGNANDFIGSINFPVEMRASPTLTITAAENGTVDGLGGITSSDSNASCISFVRMANDGIAGRRGLNVNGDVDAEL